VHRFGSDDPHRREQNCIPLVLLSAVTKIPEGIVIGFRNLAWAPNSQNIMIPIKTFGGQGGYFQKSS
jgi:hypothetical protein